MTCPFCPITVQKSLDKVDSVTYIEVNFEKRAANVRFDDAETGAAQLMKANPNVGYPATATP